MIEHELLLKCLVNGLAIKCVGMSLPRWHQWRRLLLHPLSHSLLFCRDYTLVLSKLSLTVLIDGLRHGKGGCRTLYIDIAQELLLMIVQCIDLLIVATCLTIVHGLESEDLCTWRHAMIFAPILY